MVWIDKSISIILPVFNEEDNIERVVSSIFDFFIGKGSPFEIILVNDGSTDKTPIIIEQLVRDDKDVQVIHHFTNRGYGAALISGFQKARYETVAFIDSDCQFDVSEIEKFLLYYGEYDIVAGYRIRRRDSLYRVLIGVLYTRLISILFGVSLKDINCGFKLLRKSMLDRIELFSKGALINAEILVKAKQMGCSVKEIGVNHFPRKKGKQTGARFTVISKAIYELWKLWVKKKLGK